MTQTTLLDQEELQWVLMAKALRGELSAQEQEQFTVWLNADESHAQLWADATEVWEEAGTLQEVSFEPNTALAWENLCDKLALEETTPVIAFTAAPELIEPSRFSLNTLMRYAAVLFVAAGLSWFTYKQVNSSPEWAQVATLSGERKLVFLPDSTMVTLNGNSTLRYQTSFEGPERNVELSGEAFFQVRKNPAQPFVIASGDARTTVLGTSFNVKTSTAAVEVAVVTGKVSLASASSKKELILTPGLTGTLTDAGTLTQTEQATTAAAWRTLSFQASSLKEIASQLENFFGVSVDVTNTALQSCQFTGTFENPDLTEIFKVLAASSDVSIKKTGVSSYTISGPGCR